MSASDPPSQDAMEASPERRPARKGDRSNTMQDAQRQAKLLQDQTDNYVGQAMDKVGGRTWCENIVDSKQFLEYPATTLLLARAVRGTLGFFIVVCVVALVSGYFFEGKITTVEEIEQMEIMNLPSIAICPIPWGSKFAEPLVIESTSIVQVPGGLSGGRVVNHTSADCLKSSPRLGGCSCYDFSATTSVPHGERGILDYLEYAKVSFKAGGGGGVHKEYAFSFFADELMPQQWTYTQLGHTTAGDLQYGEVAKGKTEFTEGTAIPRFGFRLSGDAPDDPVSGKTTIMFGYDKYIASVLATFSDKYSVFAMMTFMITFCAAINNFGLFDIVFPEKVDDEAPRQLAPNGCCVALCGSCCIFCHPKRKSTGSEEESEESEGLLDKTV